jgi:imidazolonepropionase-like amidohydrolase
MKALRFRWSLRHASRAASIVGVFLLSADSAAAQNVAQQPASRFLIRAKRMIDGASSQPITPGVVLVEGDRILAVGADAESGARARSATLVDLGDATLLPGLIDNHTHVLLQGDISAADYDVQLLKESIPYRTIRATVAARTALMNGFTTIRDLETEGAMYADVDLKTAIDR